MRHKHRGLGGEAKTGTRSNIGKETEGLRLKTGGIRVTQIERQRKRD